MKAIVNDRAVVEPSGGHPQEDSDEQHEDDYLDDVGVYNGEQPSAGRDDPDQPALCSRRLKRRQTELPASQLGDELPWDSKRDPSCSSLADNATRRRVPEPPVPT